jgi:hypothetical protein
LGIAPTKKVSDRSGGTQNMEPNTDWIVITTACGTAVYAALCLDYFATDKFGFPLQTVCNGSALIALLIGLYVAIDYFGDRLKKVE